MNDEAATQPLPTSRGSTFPPRRWLRRALVAVAALALLLGTLYEASTDVARGSLRGEAFYDGRPTSYWRERIDGWVARFDAPKDAEWYVRLSSPISSTLPMPPRPTPWERTCVWLGLPALSDNGEPPGILSAGESAEAVWRELEEDDAYRKLIAHARRNAAFAFMRDLR